MVNLIILSGPTAVGKTEISLELAEKLNGEIISADSMQIYKYMDVGSAKIRESEMKGIKHHLIDIVSPFDSFSAAEYKKNALEAIKDITSRNKLPIIVGGTGLYINSLIYDYDFTEVCQDEEYRTFLQNIALEKGTDAVHLLLKDEDIDSYNRLFPNDLKRVIRALEVKKVTGKTINDFNTQNSKQRNFPYNYIYCILNMNREKLYDRINGRVDIMFENGLVDEVIKLKDLGCTSDMQSMKGIGYKEVFSFLSNDMDKANTIELIKKNSRNYAKRQLTWFRKASDAIWFDKDILTDEAIVDSIIKYAKTK